TSQTICIGRAMPAPAQALPEKHAFTFLACGIIQAAIPPVCARTVPRGEPAMAWVSAGGQGHVDHHVYRDGGVDAGDGACAELGAGADRRGSAAFRRDVSRKQPCRSRRTAAIT